jgi:hypothetical protein
MKPRTISRTEVRVMQHLRDHPGSMLWDVREALELPHAAEKALRRLRGFGLAQPYRLHEEQGNGCFGWKLTDAGQYAVKLCEGLVASPGDHRYAVPGPIRSSTSATTPRPPASSAPPTTPSTSTAVGRDSMKERKDSPLAMREEVEDGLRELLAGPCRRGPRSPGRRRTR